MCYCNLNDYTVHHLCPNLDNYKVHKHFPGTEPPILITSWLVCHWTLSSSGLLIYFHIYSTMICHVNTVGASPVSNIRTAENTHKWDLTNETVGCHTVWREREKKKPNSSLVSRQMFPTPPNVCLYERMGEPDQTRSAWEELTFSIMYRSVLLPYQKNRSVSCFNVKSLLCLHDVFSRYNKIFSRYCDIKIITLQETLPFITI